MANAPVLGWSSSVKTLFLSKDIANLRKNSALDASTITHLTTEAVIDFLSSGNIYNLNGDTNHQDCGANSGPFLKNDCCRSKNGCSKAISAGIADYVNAMIFPNSPMLGDFISADLEGSKSCSLSRNPTKNRSLTFQQAYDSCASSGRTGQFYDMGAVLSSALVEISAQLTSEEKKEFLLVLLSAVQQLKGSHHFIDFRDLLLIEAAKSSFQNKLETVIQTELAKRL